MEKLKYKMTVNDYIQANNLLYRTELIIMKLLFGLSTVYFSGLMLISQRLLFWSIVGVLWSIIFFFWDKIILPIMAHWKVRKLGELQGEIEVDIGDGVVFGKSEVGVSEIKKAYRIVISKKLILVVMSPGVFFFLPRRIFTNDAQYSNVIKLLSNLSFIKGMKFTSCMKRYGTAP